VKTENKFISDKTSTHIQISATKINLRDEFAPLEITESELIKVIHGMKNKKSAGLDDISPYLLKKNFAIHVTTSIRISRCLN
jgi:hypothetical protein